ncbi:hypothetical protein N7513_005446 [Penicillium frequentans]|nr:hypothetical protein N7513_005446 [Penicillium glabrum]
MSLRACDGCRVRKVRCDGVPSPEHIPCFHCRTSGTACKFEQAPKKRGPKSKSRRSVASAAGPHTSHGTSSPLANYDDTSSLTTSASPLLGPVSPVDGRTWGPTVSTATTGSRVFTPSGAADLNDKIENIHQDLVRSLAAVDSNWSLSATVERCINVYMEVIFGIRPIVCEARIRSNLCLKPPRLSAEFSFLSCSSRSVSLSTVPGALEEIRSYTLVIALCAGTAYLLSTPDGPNGALIGPIFLHASHELLHLYEYADIECPDSSSLVIRMFQAGALHTDCKLRPSWHLFGAALRLGEQMQLHDPRSLQGLDPLEVRLRVMAFRTLRISARYHRDLENHPLSICDPPWSALPSIDAESDVPPMMMTPSSMGMPSEYESQNLVAFSLSEKVWIAASDILVDLECFARLDGRGTSIISTLSESHRDYFIEPYSAFLSVLDHLPQFLHSPDSVELQDPAATAIQRRNFWIQRTNLLVQYHCLRMLVLNRFAQHGLTTMIGVQSTDAMIALRKTEIAHDMNAFIKSVPFDSLQVNGEACVTKIRYMGATLLEVIHQVQAPQVVNRANSLFSSLLDILTKLDSRASDELVNESYIVAEPVC